MPRMHSAMRSMAGPSAKKTTRREAYPRDSVSQPQTPSQPDNASKPISNVPEADAVSRREQTRASTRRHPLLSDDKSIMLTGRTVEAAPTNIVPLRKRRRLILKTQRPDAYARAADDASPKRPRVRHPCVSCHRPAKTALVYRKHCNACFRTKYPQEHKRVLAAQRTADQARQPRCLSCGTTPARSEQSWKQFAGKHCAACFRTKYPQLICLQISKLTDATTQIGRSLLISL